MSPSPSTREAQSLIDLVPRASYHVSPSMVQSLDRVLWAGAISKELRSASVSSKCSSSSDSSDDDQSPSKKSRQGERTAPSLPGKKAEEGPAVRRASLTKMDPSLPPFLAKGYRLRCNRSNFRPPFDPPSPDSFLVYPSKTKPHRQFVIVKNFFSAADLGSIQSCFSHPSVSEIRDRKGNLNYKHTAYRLEVQMRLLAPHLYDRCMGVCHWADTLLWKENILKRGRFYPEMEYIVYDCSIHERGHIERHVDNCALVTFVAMLSRPGVDFEGGENCFDPPETKKDPQQVHRQVRLEQGDMVLFRGERLNHWITPVREGRRAILQLELSKI